MYVSLLTNMLWLRTKKIPIIKMMENEQRSGCIFSLKGMTPICLLGNLNKPTSFNKFIINTIFDNCKDALRCLNYFPSERIWSLDETSFRTVKDPKFIIICETCEVD